MAESVEPGQPTDYGFVTETKFDNFTRTEVSSSVEPGQPTDYGFVTETKFDNFTRTEVSSSHDALGVLPQKLAKVADSKESRWTHFKTALGNSGDALIPEVIGSQNVFWVLFWVLAYVGLTTVFIFQMSTLVTSYLEFEVDTQISIMRKTEATFPSVVVCNTNPVRKSIISKITKYQGLGNLDAFVTSTMYSTAAADMGTSFSVSCTEGQVQCPDSVSHQIDQCYRAPISISCNLFYTNKINKKL